MKELRIDKITDDLIIFAADRMKRPLDKSSHQIEEQEETEVFMKLEGIQIGL